MMDLKNLRVGIPYKWKIQTVSRAEPKAQCVAYIDARDVMKLLDLVVGPENWQDDYKMVGDKWMAGVGIKTDTEWVWKWDTGTAGDFEREKSEVSDSFKRAAVKWGVGRFLYDLKFEWIDTDKAGSGAKPVRPDNGQIMWNLSEFINSKPKHQQRIEKYKNAMRDLVKRKVGNEDKR